MECRVARQKQDVEWLDRNRMQSGKAETEQKVDRHKQNA